jgi:ABC-type glycerol-3-phosphate transport system substrate-binding protein
MFKRKVFVFVAGLVILTIFLAACTSETVEVPVEVEVTRIVEGESQVVVVTGEPEPTEPRTGPELITWWSHWANEPAKVAVITKIAADYEAEHPDVDIVLTWWDKAQLRPALRSTMTAGEGYPDITSDWCQIAEVEAGWCESWADTIPVDRFVPGAEKDGSYEHLGIPGYYKVNIGFFSDMIFYNKEIFEELGIEIPDDYTFTQDEWVGIMQTCSDAGYAGIANAIGNRTYPGLYVPRYGLFNLVGGEECNTFNAGLQSWDTPEVRQALEWSVEMRDAGAWPNTFASMGVDEYHVYFHTQHKACTLWIGNWYSGRAFKPVEQGGQDPNWHFGMLRYPLMDGVDPSASTGLWGGYESGYHVLAGTGHEETAMDILNFMAQPKYGALWTAVTNGPSAIKFDPATDWPSPELLEEMGVVAGQWNWYWEEFNKVYGDMATENIPYWTGCGDFIDAMVAALNEGLPQGLITVDEAIEMMDANLCNE